MRKQMYGILIVRAFQISVRIHLHQTRLVCCQWRRQSGAAASGARWTHAAFDHSTPGASSHGARCAVPPPKHLGSEQDAFCTRQLSHRLPSNLRNGLGVRDYPTPSLVRVASRHSTGTLGACDSDYFADDVGRYATLNQSLLQTREAGDWIVRGV